MGTTRTIRDLENMACKERLNELCLDMIRGGAWEQTSVMEKDAMKKRATNCLGWLLGEVQKAVRLTYNKEDMGYILGKCQGMTMLICVTCWNSLPGDAVESPSLKIFMNIFQG